MIKNKAWKYFRYLSLRQNCQDSLLGSHYRHMKNCNANWKHKEYFILGLFPKTVWQLLFGSSHCAKKFGVQKKYLQPNEKFGENLNRSFIASAYIAYFLTLYLFLCLCELKRISHYFHQSKCQISANLFGEKLLLLKKSRKSKNYCALRKSR